MNIFNRIIVVLLLLAILLLAVVLAIFPTQALVVGQSALGAAANGLRSMEGSNFWLLLAARIVLVLAVALVAVVLLWLEVRSPGPRRIKVHTEAGSQAEVMADAVSQRLAWHIDQLADVVSVVPHVRPRGRSVDVLLDLETSPDVDVPMKTDEVVACVKEIIVERMGLQAGKIQVNISHAAYPEDGAYTGA